FDQGSGWAWLGYNPTTKKLEAVATANQDPLLGYVPLIGIDLWEHAFYLDYVSFQCLLGQFQVEFSI
ncbi:hypothetical protein JCM5350_000241, partial [Sporobolomyces pararoseus]